MGNITTKEFFEKLDGIGRKPNQWETIPRVNIHRLPKKLKALLDNVPVMYSDELWTEDPINPLVNFDIKNYSPVDVFGVPTLTEFILFIRDTNKMYYVDTQGYNYCRYIIEVFNPYTIH